MINIIFVLETSINIIYMLYQPHKTRFEEIFQKSCLLNSETLTHPFKGEGHLYSDKDIFQNAWNELEITSKE